MSVLDQLIDYVTYESLYNPCATAVRGSLSELLYDTQILTGSEKTEVGGWSPVELTPGPHCDKGSATCQWCAKGDGLFRASRKVRSVNAAVFDVDVNKLLGHDYVSVEELDVVQQTLLASGVAYICVPSFSCFSKFGEGHWRLVLFFAHPVTPEEWTLLWYRIPRRYGFAHLIGEQAKDPARFWYLACLRDTTAAKEPSRDDLRWTAAEGDVIDVDMLLAAPASPQEKTKFLERVWTCSLRRPPPRPRNDPFMEPFWLEIERLARMRRLKQEKGEPLKLSCVPCDVLERLVAGEPYMRVHEHGWNNMMRWLSYELGSCCGTVSAQRGGAYRRDTEQRTDVAYRHGVCDSLLLESTLKMEESDDRVPRQVSAEAYMKRSRDVFVGGWTDGFDNHLKWKAQRERSNAALKEALEHRMKLRSALNGGTNL